MIYLERFKEKQKNLENSGIIKHYSHQQAAFFSYHLFGPASCYRPFCDVADLNNHQNSSFQGV
jgi:replication initiation and membrane attachment protein DnaB